MEPKTRVFIVDDHAMVREGLKALFQDDPDIEICGEAASGEEALQIINEKNADVVLMDVRLPAMSGIDACRALRQSIPDVKVIILTSYTEPRMVMEAFDSGASGYLLKQIDHDQLHRSILQVRDGQTAMAAELAQGLARSVQESKSAHEISKRIASLSPQERKVSSLVSEGMTNKEIADAMKLNEKTVKNYLTNAFSKLGISRRSQLAVLFSRREGRI